MEKKLIYLAVPYSHADENVKHQRFEAVNKAASFLMSAGELAFSPISHTHPIALAGNLPGGWEYWEKLDRAYLECCKKLVVLMLDGWKESVGVKGEIEIARELGIPIEYINTEYKVVYYE